MVFARDWFSSPLLVYSSPHLAKPFSVTCNPKKTTRHKTTTMKLEKVTVEIDNLLLDPNNPRFADISDDALNIDKSRFSEPAIQTAAYEKMTNPKFDTITLANSIATVGFVPVDNIVVVKLNETQYYVIEGNRRTTAIKYLLLILSLSNVKSINTFNHINNFLLIIICVMISKII